MKADLHSHTSLSDCSYSQESVIRFAKENNVTHLAITDHDTTVGLKEALLLGEKYGVEVIPGIEISAYDYDNNKKCHIVGLFVSPNSKELEELTANVNRDRKSNFIKQVEVLRQNGYKINIDDFKFRGSYSIYKQHIMQVLIDKGYALQIYGSKYRELFKGNGICNFNVNYPNAKDAVKVLRSINAFPILAHPGVYNNFDIIESLVDVGLMGIESIYPNCSPEHYQYIMGLTQRYNLIASGGTDFHGQYSATPCDKVGDYCVDPSIVVKIKKRLV